ncbi:Endoglucanase [Meloidogyne graminicola]|uniref:Endoglucanase n=1 Tax=Meloidogyne graminicola TaxID=189291 RepID=A0A8S9ZFJ3_9BILA|nr:Endoglucanase [Meloidogyne graminicola]
MNFFNIFVIALILLNISNFGVTEDSSNNEANLPLSNNNDDDEECNCENEDNQSTDANLPVVNIKTTANPPSYNEGSGNGGVSGSVDLHCELRNKWDNGANFILVFKNNGNSQACAVKFQIDLSAGQSIQSIWNVDKVSDNIYVLPRYMPLSAGEENRNAGLVVNGPATLPKITILGQGECKPY